MGLNDLDYCDKCIQMTAHRNGKCLKCNLRGALKSRKKYNKKKVRKLITVT